MGALGPVCGARRAGRARGRRAVSSGFRCRTQKNGSLRALHGYPRATPAGWAPRSHARPAGFCRARIPTGPSPVPESRSPRRDGAGGRASGKAPRNSPVAPQGLSNGLLPDLIMYSPVRSEPGPGGSKPHGHDHGDAGAAGDRGGDRRSAPAKRSPAARGQVGRWSSLCSRS
jgi:hypothetical protein